MPEFEKERQARGAEDERRARDGRSVRKPTQPLKERRVHPAVVDARAEADEPDTLQARGGELFRRHDLGLERRRHDPGDLGGAAVVDRLAEDHGFGASHSGLRNDRR